MALLSKTKIKSSLSGHGSSTSPTLFTPLHSRGVLYHTFHTIAGGAGVDDVTAEEAEFDAAYRFRPNPLNNPRRNYY
jgi:hypothetical protein